MPVPLILVVDDIADNRYLLQAIMEGSGYRVTVAGDGVEALEAARRDRPDAVISDALMPRMDGFHLCRAWMDDPSLKSIPFLFYTASFTASQDQDLALSLGARRYLIKPQEPEGLLEAVREALGEKAPPYAVAPTLAADDTAFYALHDAALSEKLDHKVQQLADANRRLRESEQSYRMLFESNPHPMGVYDMDSLRFLAVNDAAIDRYGYGRDEFLAMTIADIRPARDVPRLLATLARGPAVYEHSGLWQHCRKDGSIIDVEIISHAIDFRGHHAEIILANDVTERLRVEALNEQQVEQLQAALMGTVHVAMNLGEIRDPYTAGHQRRVGDIAASIGGELGLDEHRCHGIRVAGYLHDLGKLAIPAEILSRPTRLSDLEFDLVKGHAQGGYEVLKDVDFPWPVAQVALQHHERMDGSGYPSGLKGDAILLEARIIAVADVIEAMASHRPYRASRGLNAALAEIERGSGTLYDADVVAACLRWVHARGDQLPV